MKQTEMMIDINHYEHRWLVTFAIRYCLSRQSYMTSYCCSWIKEHWYFLDDTIKKQIAKDIDRELARPGMMEMDRIEWEELSLLWRLKQ